MNYDLVLLPLAIILLVSKFLSKLSAKLGLPNVVGMLLAGVLIGFIQYIPNQEIITPPAMEGLGFLAKIGVILIMFSAGLSTDFESIKEVGKPAVFITLAGVIAPMLLGLAVAVSFSMSNSIMTDLFYGVILTATSVSVTVATLKEMGKLNSKVGNTIITAAILDDIIGIVVLSVVVSLDSKKGESANPIKVILMTLAFFICAIVFGFIIKKIFMWLSIRYPHHRLIPIYSVAVCFFFSFASEHWFGVADITGAFVAGLVLSGTKETLYVDRRSDIMTYMIFSPVFFANIGITTKFGGINSNMILFGTLFILAGILGKVIGCSGTALLCKFDARDSLKVGVGMMARAEVALVCAQKGV
ncbi:MAG: cation:proton antiporter, partial [Clostridia bacterium]|nr:cation:proton antiporter [Clostridia bacterium]